MKIGYPKTAEAFTVFSNPHNFFDSDGRQGNCSELVNDVVIMSMIEKIGKSSTTYYFKLENWKNPVQIERGEALQHLVNQTIFLTQTVGKEIVVNSSTTL